MERPALIFDFGNVIAYFDFERATAKLGARIGMSGRELLDHLDSVGFARELQEYERGRLSAVEFSTRILGLIPLTMTHEDFADAWSDIFTANESIISLIENLKSQGYQLLLGSNTNDLHTSHFRRQFATTLAHFDHFLLSYEVGHVKPSREFFLACATAAGRPPSGCIFIDDLPENVAGARAAGLVGVVYRSTPQLINELADLGVEARSKRII